MLQVDINVPGSEARSYCIRIASGLLDSILDQISRDLPAKALFIVTDVNLVRSGILDRLHPAADIPRFIIDPPGEISKHMGTVTSILEAMERANLGRDCAVIALGGGTVGDIAAFAASVFKRGVPVAQIPTTTLAQADSAIGGKTGVDSTISKNAYGTFWHPAAVFMDVDCLQTLDQRQYRAGLVESIKHGMIADQGLFSYIEQRLDAILACDPTAMTHLAYSNCRIKGRIVEQDPDEKNLRRVLNYGHTIGHAVEAASRYQLLHGEAVAIGLVAAGMIEVTLGLGQDGRLERLEELLHRIGMPTRISPYATAQQVMELLAYDKKAIDRKPRFVLTTRLGQVYCSAGQWAVEVDRKVVEEVIKRLL